MWQELLKLFLTLFFLRQQIAALALFFALRTVQILTPNRQTVPLRLGWGKFAKGCIVMGNAYSPFSNQNQSVSTTSSHHDDESGWDNDITTTCVVAEENAGFGRRVRLSDLVLKSVVDQK
jgi:hypothetical protein